jgi:hypothetical protein
VILLRIVQALPLGEYENLWDLYLNESHTGKIILENKELSIMWNTPQPFEENFGGK